MTNERSIANNNSHDFSAVVLPTPEPTVFNYDPITVHGKYAYLAGQIPKEAGELAVRGIVGVEVDLAQAQRAATICADQSLAWLDHCAGGLANIDSILRAKCFVAHGDGFAEISQVADAASGRLIEVLGPRGRHSRSVLGVKSLPRYAPVLLEVTAALKQDIG
ncbi:MAG: RidA family protein [Rhodobacteraceae bacterium]|nr:RidA family protein [Paracoccaceae bacterium]